MRKHRGSCLCGRVTFEITGDFESFFLCHCNRCQKNTGSAHAANVFSSTASLTWISGEEGVKTFNLKNTRHAKSFCSICGSPMPNLKMKGRLLVVPAGSLDEGFFMKPTAHLFNSSKAKWNVDLEKVSKFDGLPK